MTSRNPIQKLRKLRLWRNTKTTFTSKHQLTLTEWLSIAQLAALVIGGVWTAYQFLQFDKRDKELASQKSKIELQRLQATPLQFKQDIAIWDYSNTKKPNQSNLGVDYHYSITNVSGQPVKIALVVVHCFLLSPQTFGKADLIEVPMISVSDDSPWHRAISKAYLEPDEELPGGVVKAKQGFTIKPEPQQGATGILQPNDASWGTLSVVTAPRKADYIGFSVDAFVRFADGTERWITGDQYARLVPGDYAGSPSPGRGDEKK